MLKLYKKKKNALFYWETWDKNLKTGIVHWGKVGERGEDKEVKSTVFSDYRGIVQREVDEMISEGFQEIDNHHTLLIEYKIDGKGSPGDLGKRHRLEQRMNETLGWTGLGHCDGGSSGGGTMEICCFVVDLNIAKKAIEKDLKNTEFGNYIRIYDENTE